MVIVNIQDLPDLLRFESPSADSRIGGRPLGHGQPMRRHRSSEGLPARTADTETVSDTILCFSSTRGSMGQVGKIVNIIKRYQCPENASHFQFSIPKHRKKQRRKKNHPQNPSSKKNAEGSSLHPYAQGARLDDGITRTSISPLPTAYSTTLASMPAKGVGNRSGKTRAPPVLLPQNFRKHNASPIPDPIHKAGAQQVHNKLRQKKHCGDHRDLSQGNAVVLMKLQNNKGAKFTTIACVINPR